jgi:hypothetical protein
MDAEQKLQADLAAAAQAGRQLAEQATREYVRDYLVSYRIVREVDSQGEPCEYCNDGAISCNTYAHIHRQSGGTDVEMFLSCSPCALDVLDAHADVASEFLVIVERLAAP